MTDLHEQLKAKYEALGDPLELHLKGLLHSKPLTYWDYVEVDTLLSLQKPRTDYPDELIFILYHQVTELLLRLIRHELEQLCTEEVPSAETFLNKS